MLVISKTFGMDSVHLTWVVSRAEPEAQHVFLPRWIWSYAHSKLVVIDLLFPVRTKVIFDGLK